VELISNGDVLGAKDELVSLGDVLGELVGATCASTVVVRKLQLEFVLEIVEFSSVPAVVVVDCMDNVDGAAVELKSIASVPFGPEASVVKFESKRSFVVDVIVVCVALVVVKVVVCVVRSRS
jgi:hypothetical protein